MSEFADIFSESRELTKKERKFVQRDVDYIYDTFTGKVMKARKIDKKSIPNVAEGRVFTGRQALKKKLIDDAGGIILAVEYAKLLAKAGDRYKIKQFPDETTFFPDMFNSPQIRVMSRYFKSLVKYAGYLNFNKEEALYLYPYTIEIK